MEHAEHHPQQLNVPGCEKCWRVHRRKAVALVLAGALVIAGGADYLVTRRSPAPVVTTAPIIGDHCVNVGNQRAGVTGHTLYCVATYNLGNVWNSQPVHPTTRRTPCTQTPGICGATPCTQTPGICGATP